MTYKSSAKFSIFFTFQKLQINRDNSLDPLTQAFIDNLCRNMKEFRIMSFFIIVLFSLSTARDTITPTQPLGDNETLISAGGSFVLGFFTPPNSKNRYVGIWYSNIKNQTIVWVANRSKPVISSAGVLSVTSNGTMMITDGSSTVVWSAGSTTSVLTDPMAQLLDDGNFVLKQNENDKSYVWQGFDYPTDTLLPGMKLGVDRTSGLNRTLVAWKSNNDPSPGKYHAAIDIVSNPEIVLFAGSVKVWRSGSWERSGVEGSQFSGISNVLAYYSDKFINNYEEVTYSYQISEGIVLMVKVLQSGKIQWLLWVSDLGQWITDLEVPGNQCDNIQECGPFAICGTEYLICSCLKGFMPKNLTKWNSGNYTEGCIRKTALNCMNHDFQVTNDGFEVINQLKLPESSVSSGFSTFSLDTCRATCLYNCSCTAFAISEGGGGCVIWVTELLDMVKLLGYSDPNLYVRLAAAEFDSQSQPEKIKLKTVAILVSLLSGALLVLCVSCFLWKRNKWIRGAKKIFSKQSKKGDREKDLDLPLYDFGTIAAATGQFSDRNKLGQGGFGPVYKGKLGEDQEIAVKRLAKTSLQGTVEFKNEVMLIAKLQNINLVQLLGCCVEGEERMLIYEYMPNKSLDAFLFVKEKSALLDWRTRYQIIVGITRGLFYLHHDSRFRIIHRDLKASNILLDVKMNPKISDFGMARLFGGDETDFNTRKVVGTYGYMSPEYAMQGTYSLKSDVFSFGVLLLEIISGKKNRGIYAFSPHLNLVAHAWSLWNEGDILELVDESMSNTFPRNDVLKCIKIGLLCVQDHPDDRPLMSSVIEMLSADITTLPQPKQPGFIGRIGPVEFEQLENRQSSCTSNCLTSTLDGR